MGIATKMPRVTSSVLNQLSGFRNPRSFQVMLRTRMRHIATIKVALDHSKPLAIKGSSVKYSSRIKNITVRYRIMSKRNPW